MLRGDVRPFEFAGDERGVLCLHGFTGTPFEMRHLGEMLAARGFTVVGPLLPGHGGDPAILDAMTWTDWYRAAETEIARLRERCPRVAVVGMSMGGLLALHLAFRRGSDLRAIATLGTPLWLHPAVRYGVPAVQAASRWLGFRLIPKPGGGSDIRDPELRRANPAMRAFPVNALASFLELAQTVRMEIDQVMTPVFIGHGSLDHTAPPACAAELLRRLASPDVELRFYRRSYHVVTIDVERDQLAEDVATFLAERMN